MFMLNGEERRCESGMTLASLAAALGVAQNRAAIEKNQEIIPSSLWMSEPVADGDRIEIVGFIGGG